VLAVELIEERDREQGIASGRAVERAGELAGEVIVGKPQRQVLLDRGLLEPSERERGGLAMRDQLGDDPRQGMRPGKLARTICPDHEQSRGLSPAPEHRDQLGRGVIRPLQVVERQNDRHLGAQRFECIGELP
jgi:hypothetical protein